MRSTFAGLNTMVRGIQNNQLSLDTTGHNITNASTEGYSRQRVDSAATNYQERPSLYGGVYVGGGVDVVALNRARNIYADKQYWSENSAQNLYKTYKTNYDKVETIFNDSKKTGILNAMQQFYSAWVNLSDYASDAASRTSVIAKVRGPPRCSYPRPASPRTVLRAPSAPTTNWYSESLALPRMAESSVRSRCTFTPLPV